MARFISAVVATILLALAGIHVPDATGQVSTRDFEGTGVLVRVSGNVRLGPDEREAVVVVVDGDAEISGEVAVVVVVDGTATLDGARVRELIVVGGTARLFADTIVEGDIQLVGSDIIRGDEALVRGDVLTGTAERIGRGLLIFGIVFGLGLMAAVLLSGVVAAAVAPHAMRSAGAILTDESGKALLGALFIWIGLPILAGTGFATIIGIPIGLGIMFILLPAMGFLGFIVSGIRLGDYILGVARGSDEAWHPYLAALLGLAILLVAGLVPVFGSFVIPIAAVAGSGALAVHAKRSIGAPRREPGAPIPEYVLTDI